MYRSISACYKRLMIKMDEISTCIELLEEQRSFLASVGADTSKYVELLKSPAIPSIMYNAIIIGIYSSFEHYIDCIFEEYLAFRQNNCIPFTSEEKRKYYATACEFITKPNKYRNYNYSIKDVILSMYHLECEAKDQPIKQLFLRHSGNLNYANTQSLAKKIGLTSFSSAFSSHATDAQYLAEISNEELREDLGRQDSVIKAKWQDIIDQRNSIAHSGMVENRFSFELLKEYVQIFRVIGRIICHIVLETIASILISNETMGVFSPIHAIYNNEILCTDLGSCPLSVDDIIISVNSQNKYKILTIQSIQVDHKDVSIVTDPGTTLGMKLDKTVKQNHAFYYFPEQLPPIKE